MSFPIPDEVLMTLAERIFSVDRDTEILIVEPGTVSMTVFIPDGRIENIDLTYHGEETASGFQFAMGFGFFSNTLIVSAHHIKA